MSDNPTDLRELLGKPMSDFPDLPNLPGQKWFYGKLLSMSAGHSSKKMTPLYRFTLRITDPGKDVTSAELKAVADAGFSLADYDVGADFYLTPNAMKMFRRLVTSLGFSENLSFIEALSLDDDCNPTQQTQEKIRGLDVMFRTPPADDQGRVFLNHVDMLTGVKK